MKVLYAGFDLCDPKTSVSMTINGPAPTILAMFLNTAIDQQLDKFRADNGREPTEDEAAEDPRVDAAQRARHGAGGHPQGGPGAEHLHLLHRVRLKVMGDIQEWFVEHDVRNFYSVSISGYHIAEAGANPISQLAFTLANGFTYVEAYLARGMHVDDFAPNLSFFFSNGMDPEYTVLGRVARRIWAVAMRDRYGANERSQKLKYHCQTSGRSLHAQEIAFNDIRTTLQALIATYDNANSLHTNAYDEAITTPTEESVRRAMAIQLIINREWGLAKNENPIQGAFIIDELTDLVEEAVLQEFEAISERGGVLGAMETGYQRGKIQEESLLLRAPQARRQLADRRRQHVPQSARRRRRRRSSSSRARRRRRRSRSSRGWRTSTRAMRREAPAALARLQAGGDRGRQRVRRADGHGARVLARARSRTRCSRWAGSTGAACSVGSRRRDGRVRALLRGPLRDTRVPAPHRPHPGACHVAHPHGLRRHRRTGWRPRPRRARRSAPTLPRARGHPQAGRTGRRRPRAGGAEIVAADLDDPASVEGAMRGAHAAYCVTNFWEHFSPREGARAGEGDGRRRGAGRRDARRLVDARGHAAIRDAGHAWLEGAGRQATTCRTSTPRARPTRSSSRARRADHAVPHVVLLGQPHPLRHAAAARPGRRAAGSCCRWARRKMPGIAAADIGACAYGVIARGGEFAGRTVGIAGEHLSGAEMAEQLGRALGEPVRHVSPTIEEYAAFGFPGADDLANMFRFYHDFEREFRASRDVGGARALYPGLQTFAGWLARTRRGCRSTARADRPGR